MRMFAARCREETNFYIHARLAAFAGGHSVSSSPRFAPAPKAAPFRDQQGGPSTTRFLLFPYSSLPVTLIFGGLGNHTGNVDPTLRSIAPGSTALSPCIRQQPRQMHGSNCIKSMSSPASQGDAPVRGKAYIRHGLGRTMAIPALSASRCHDCPDSSQPATRCRAWAVQSTRCDPRDPRRACPIETSFAARRRSAGFETDDWHVALFASQTTEGAIRQAAADCLDRTGRSRWRYRQVDQPAERKCRCPAARHSKVDPRAGSGSR